jgi:hypothetical protein
MDDLDPVAAQQGNLNAKAPPMPPLVSVFLTAPNKK